MDLPPVYEATLTEEGLEALLSDLTHLEGPLEINVKLGAHVHAEQAGSLSLAEAAQLLREKAARAIQVRYVHEGKGWCDTLLHAPQGIRLVRMALFAPG